MSLPNPRRRHCCYASLLASQLLFFLTLCCNPAGGAVFTDQDMDFYNPASLNKPDAGVTANAPLMRPRYLDCDPCIRRSDFVVKAIVHGRKDSKYWRTVETSMKQAAQDMNIQLELELYESFDPIVMANDIQAAVNDQARQSSSQSSRLNRTTATNSNHPHTVQKNRLDALIVTIPSPIVHDAIQSAVAFGIPVFGFNSGYTVAQSLGLLGFVAQHEYKAGVLAAHEFLRIFEDLEPATQTRSTRLDLDEGDELVLPLPNGTYVLTDLNTNTSGVESATTTTATTSTSRRRPIQRALFVNHEKGNSALDDRYQGFRDALLTNYNITDNTSDMVIVEELVVDIHTYLEDQSLEKVLRGCPYDIVLMASSYLTPHVLNTADRFGCLDNNDPSVQMKIGMFDEMDYLSQELLQGRLAFAMPQQEYLQGVLPVLMASLYVTTGTLLVPPGEEDEPYMSGPLIVNVDNLPPDSQTTCQAQAFPVCSSSHASIQRNTDSDNDKHPLLPAQIATGTTSTTTRDGLCDCFDRHDIRIGGVLHGVTSDHFWDPVFLAAQQAAKDMGVRLDMERLTPETDADILHEKMAARIQALCQDGVHGIFVTIPEHEKIYQAVRACQQLNIPVVAVNSNPRVSEELGVIHHIGQDEFRAGYLAGKEMLEAGMKEGYCLNQAGNSGVNARCEGFMDAIQERGDGYYGEIVVAPLDLDASFTLMFQEAIGRPENDDWEAVGMLIGARHLEPSLLVKEQHPKLLLGMFDVGSYADLIFSALDDGRLLFTSDQQPYLQGNLPVYLLSYMAYTQQHLLDKIILTGPSLIKARPTPEQQTCEANLFQVCVVIPEENFNFLSAGWLGIGYFFAALTILTGLICLVWVYYFREKSIVKASQPPFLVMLAVGAMAQASAIIPMGIETDYRMTKDPFTGEVMGMNPNIKGVDVACMAVPWLYAAGFVLMFSALLAKIWRVKLIYQAAEMMQRRRVGYKDVLALVAVMFMAELVLLITWTIMSPHEWVREVTLVSSDGYALESVGKCDSDSGWYFMAAIVSFHVVCLFYALILCWQTKHIPAEFADSNYVSLSVIMIFQISILAIPIAAMVQDETDVFYFVRSCALFLQSFTVLCLIFGPKMYRTYKGDDTLPISATAGRSGRFSTNGGSHCCDGSSDQLPMPRGSKDRYSNATWIKAAAAELTPLKSTCCSANIRSICSSCRNRVSPNTGKVIPNFGKRSVQFSDDIEVLGTNGKEDDDFTVPFDNCSARMLDSEHALPKDLELLPNESCTECCLVDSSTFEPEHKEPGDGDVPSNIVEEAPAVIQVVPEEGPEAQSSPGSKSGDDTKQDKATATKQYQA